jgi:hypothetical protein
MNMNNATASINCNDLINLQAGGRRKTLKKKSLNKKTLNKKNIQKGGKKSGGKRNRKAKKLLSRSEVSDVHPGGKKVTTNIFGGVNIGISADELIDEYKNYPLDSHVTNVFNELRVSDPTDRFNYNTKILSLINSMLDKGMNQFQRDHYFIDLRHKYANVILPKQGGDQYRDVDTADLLNVLKDVVRAYIQKARPTIKVESASRKVARAVQEFKQQQEQSCPPLNDRSQTERFIDPDGHYGCRIPLEKRNITEAIDAGDPSHCPTFAGSRRSQFHVTYDNKGICREPVRTGEHFCPNPMGDPLATVHETLPGGVGICKKPFEVPQTFVFGEDKTVLPVSVINPVPGMIQNGGVRRAKKSLKKGKKSLKRSKNSLKKSKSQKGGKKKSKKGSKKKKSKKGSKKKKSKGRK